jgi:cytochrome c
MRIFILFALTLSLAAGSSTAGDLAAGQKVFNKCRACHVIGEGATNRVGPQLNGVVGRPWGAVEGYNYSANKEGTLLAIDEANPQIWDPETLRAYLRNPKDVIPRGKMAFPGVKDDTDLENLIYFLAQFDASGAKVDPDDVLAVFPADN